MLISINGHSKRPFGFACTRSLIEDIDYEPQSFREEVGLSLITGRRDLLKRREKSHLTEATKINHQIRFPLIQRVRRQLRAVAFGLSRRILDSEYKVIVYEPLGMDSSDREIFEILSEYLPHHKFDFQRGYFTKQDETKKCSESEKEYLDAKREKDFEALKLIGKNFCIKEMFGQPAVS